LSSHTASSIQACSGRDVLICYSVKAQLQSRGTEPSRTLGSGFDIVSGGELARVLAAGAAQPRPFFSGVGKSEAEIAPRA